MREEKDKKLNFLLMHATRQYPIQKNATHHLFSDEAYSTMNSRWMSAMPHYVDLTAPYKPVHSGLLQLNLQQRGPKLVPHHLKIYTREYLQEFTLNQQWPI